jgi:hypothetical protein
MKLTLDSPPSYNSDQVLQLFIWQTQQTTFLKGVPQVFKKGVLALAKNGDEQFRKKKFHVAHGKA